MSKVMETGGEINDNKSEQEIRRSERNKDKPYLSYRFLEKCMMNTQVCLNEIPSTFDEIEFRDDRSFWEKAIQDELGSHSENKAWSLVQKPNNKHIVDCF